MATGVNKEKRQIFTGCRARILMNGQRVGWAKGVSGTREYSKEAIEVVDNIETEEFATTGYRVSMRCSLVGIVTQSLVQMGLLPNIGQNSEDHLKAAIALAPFKIQVEDNITHKVQWEFSDCEIATESFDVMARSVMGKDVSIVGIRVKSDVDG